MLGADLDQGELGEAGFEVGADRLDVGLDVGAAGNAY